MVKDRIIVTMMTLGEAACQPAALDIGLAGARPITYAAVREASGVLRYVEPLLGPGIATDAAAPVGTRATVVDIAAVAGVWELPVGTAAAVLADALAARGRLERPRDHCEGTIWIADWQPRGESPLRVMMIDGTNRAFERAAPAVRPGPHVYLVAYRRP